MLIGLPIPHYTVHSPLFFADGLFHSLSKYVVKKPCQYDNVYISANLQVKKNALTNPALIVNTNAPKNPETLALLS